MQNKVGDGNVVELTNALAAGSVSGGVVVMGSLVGIATQTHALNATLPCEMEGIFDVPVTDTGGGITVGTMLGCTLSSGVVSDTTINGTTVVFFGYALEAVVASATTTINVLKKLHAAVS